jgi:sortase A
MLAYPFATDLYSGRVQRRLEAQLASPELRQAYQRREVRAGDSLTRLAIPAVDLSVVVVEGTSRSALRAGAGHYPATSLPGEAGNVAIAGHRTTYGKPFNRLGELEPGDDIYLATPLGEHTYRVTRKPYVVDRADWSPIAQTNGHTLTLTTCHPKGSAKQRLVVKAELLSTKGA